MASGRRTTTYTPEMGQRICELVATHPMGLEVLHKQFDWMPCAATVYLWISQQPTFSEMYFKAKRQQAHAIADSAMSLAANIPTYIDKDGVERIDAGILGRAKLDYQNKLWQAARLEPRMYAEKMNASVEEKTNEHDAQIKEIRAELDAKNKKEY